MENRRRTEVDGGAFFPEDLVFAILSWLPALSLIRFKCVKKSWRDLIENPNFAAKHLRNQNLSSSSDGDCLLLMRRFISKSREYETRFSLVYFADDGNDTSTVAKFMDFPFYIDSSSLTFTGYCHEIICLSDLNGYVALGNPGIRQFRALPDTCISFPSTEPKSCFTSYIGFGHDLVSGDYKVVRTWISVDDGGNYRVEVYTISTDSWREINNLEPFVQLLNWSHGSNNGKYLNDYKVVRAWILDDDGGLNHRVEVYTLSTDSWREINSSEPFMFLLHRSRGGKYLNGAYYWWIEYCLEDDEEMEITNSIIVFDMSKEVFLQIHLPDPFSDSPTEEFIVRKFSVMDGCLVLVTYTIGTWKSFYIQVIPRSDDGGIEVTELDTIGPLNGVKGAPIFWKDKEILFESLDALRIVSYKKGARETNSLPVLLSYNSQLPNDVEAEVYASSLISIAR